MDTNTPSITDAQIRSTLGLLIHGLIKDEMPAPTPKPMAPANKKQPIMAKPSDKKTFQRKEHLTHRPFQENEGLQELRAHLSGSSPKRQNRR